MVFLGWQHIGRLVFTKSGVFYVPWPFIAIQQIWSSLYIHIDDFLVGDGFKRPLFIEHTAASIGPMNTNNISFFQPVYNIEQIVACLNQISVHFTHIALISLYYIGNASNFVQRVSNNIYDKKQILFTLFI